MKIKMVDSNEEHGDVGEERIGKLAEEIAWSVLSIRISRMSIIPKITSKNESASVIRENLQTIMKDFFDFFVKEFNVQQNLSNLKKLKEKTDSNELCYLTPLKHINFVQVCNIKQRRDEFQKKIRNQQEEISELERNIEHRIMRIEQQKLYRYR